MRRGCAYVLVGALVGIVFSFGQSQALLSMWTFCTNYVPPDNVIVDAPAEGLAIWLPFILLRCFLYGAAFLLGCRIALKTVHVEPRLGQAAVAFLGGLVFCVVLFALDFSLFNGMPSSEDLISGRCPNGHLPWWPL